MRVRYRFIVALVAAFLGLASFGTGANAATAKSGGGGTQHSSSSKSWSGGSNWHDSSWRDNGCCHDRDFHDRDFHDRDFHHDHDCCHDEHFEDHCCDNGGDEEFDCGWLRDHDHDRWWRDCPH